MAQLTTITTIIDLIKKRESRKKIVNVLYQTIGCDIYHTLFSPTTKSDDVSYYNVMLSTGCVPCKKFHVFEQLLDRLHPSDLAYIFSLISANERKNILWYLFTPQRQMIVINYLKHQANAGDPNIISDMLAITGKSHNLFDKKTMFTIISLLMRFIGNNNIQISNLPTDAIEVLVNSSIYIQSGNHKFIIDCLKKAKKYDMIIEICRTCDKEYRKEIIASVVRDYPVISSDLNNLIVSCSKNDEQRLQQSASTVGKMLDILLTLSIECCDIDTIKLIFDRLPYKKIHMSSSSCQSADSFEWNMIECRRNFRDFLQALLHFSSSSDGIIFVLELLGLLEPEYIHKEIITIVSLCERNNFDKHAIDMIRDRLDHRNIKLLTIMISDPKKQYILHDIFSVIEDNDLEKILPDIRKHLATNIRVEDVPLRMLIHKTMLRLDDRYKLNARDILWCSHDMEHMIYFFDNVRDISDRLFRTTMKSICKKSNLEILKYFMEKTKRTIVGEEYLIHSIKSAGCSTEFVKYLIGICNIQNPDRIVRSLRKCASIDVIKLVIGNLNIDMNYCDCLKSLVANGMESICAVELNNAIAIRSEILDYFMNSFSLCATDVFSNVIIYAPVEIFMIFMGKYSDKICFDDINEEIKYLFNDNRSLQIIDVLGAAAKLPNKNLGSRYQYGIVASTISRQKPHVKKDPGAAMDIMNIHDILIITKMQNKNILECCRKFHNLFIHSSIELSNDLALECHILFGE